MADLNVVPVLDTLVAVIFFLLVTTSFLQLNKLSVPPSSVSTITEPLRPPPLSPKLTAAVIGDRLRVTLSWSGLEPGRATSEVRLLKTHEEDGKALLEAARPLIQSFSEKHPGEKTLQIGLGAEVSYQNLIVLMDAAKDSMPDIVLISYREAQARTEFAKLD